jgi:group I intron endonuclease
MGYTVYMHTTPNGKVYVGITSRDLNKRWKCGSGYKGQAFYNAILKYGWENIRHDVLAENLSLDEANQMEIDLIKQHKSNDKRYGYNIASGGEGSPGFKQTDEAKEKISKALKGVHKSEEHREKLRIANIGKHHTEETRLKLSESHKGKKLNQNQLETLMRYNRNKVLSAETRAKISQNSKSKKRVVCVETGQVFNAVKDASSWLGMSHNAVSNAVCGYTEGAGGYHWKYYCEEDQHEQRNTDNT